MDRLRHPSDECFPAEFRLTFRNRWHNPIRIKLSAYSGCLHPIGKSFDRNTGLFLILYQREIPSSFSALR